VLAEGVRIRDFLLTGNGGSVTQEDSFSRAPLIEVRRGRFVIENGVIRNITSRGTIRDIYTESCRYGVDVQDHKRPGKINRYIIIDGLHVRNTYMAMRTANRDFGHDGLTIRNVTGTDWPADAKEPFQVRNTSNVLIDNVRKTGIVLEDHSESGRLERYELSGNMATTSSNIPATKRSD
jgi:hypothetical protein